MLRLPAAALLLLAVAGCAGGPRFSGNTHKEKDCDPDPRGWCRFTINAAKNAWQYAQMANNAYAGRPGRPPFDLATELVERFMSPPENGGFSYAVYDRMAEGRVTETIIAYRGTDSLQDWFSGNFTGTQNRAGEEVFQIVRRQLDEVGYNTPITVTGHSLGGGIASSVSQGRPEVKAFVFNSSPNFRAEDGSEIPDRQAVVEHGEFLTIARWLKGSGNQRQNTINCRRARHPLSFVDDHSVRLLADCLTWIAAKSGQDGRARQSLTANPAIVPPDTERQPDEQAQERVIEQLAPQPAPESAAVTSPPN